MQRSQETTLAVTRKGYFAIALCFSTSVSSALGCSGSVSFANSSFDEPLNWPRSNLLVCAARSFIVSWLVQRPMRWCWAFPLYALILVVCWCFVCPLTSCRKFKGSRSSLLL